MAKDQPAAPSPDCPRCGYDQSGLIATWETACPLEGVCSECGYAFRWREVLAPEERRLPGFVEHCRWKLVPLVAFRTLAWAWLPWVLWRRVKLHHEVRPWRLLAWLCVVLVGWHVVNGGLTALEYLAWESRVNRFYQVRYPGDSGLVESSPSQPLIKGLVWPVMNFRAGNMVSVMIKWWGAPWHGLVFGSLAYPLAFYFLRGSRKLNRIRAGHVLRASVYALAWVSLPLLRRTALLMHSTIFAFIGEGEPDHWIVLEFWYPINNILAWAPYALLVWLGIYWFLAMKVGWSFRNTFYHWLLISMVVLLASATGALAINPQAYQYFLW